MLILLTLLHNSHLLSQRKIQRSRPVCKGTIGIDVALCGNCINCAEQIMPNNNIVKGKVECGVSNMSNLWLGSTVKTECVHDTSIIPRPLEGRRKSLVYLLQVHVLTTPRQNQHPSDLNVMYLKV